MADQKVSDLPSLNGADVDAADLLYIVDSSAGTAGSKKITIGQFQVAPFSAGTANGVLYLNGSKVATSGSALVFDGTNLGIGTSPTTKLDVNGITKSRGNLYGGTSNTTANVLAYANVATGGAGFSQFLFANTSTETRGYLTYSHASDALLIGTAATTKATLDSSGNLGLGVTPVAYTANARTFQLDGGANSAQIRLTNNTTGTAQTNGGLLSMDGNQLSVWNVENDALRFGTNDTERARITSGGDLLVGTASSLGSYRVQVVGTNSGIVSQVSSNAESPADLWNTATTGDNPFARFFTEGGTGTFRGSITYNRAGGLVAYNTTSDYRAKDIIGPVQDPGATIDALKVYEGVMKGATQSRPMLIAHEAQEYAPYAVSGVKDEVNEDGTPKFQQMDVSSLVPLLLAEIQSLRARVAALEAA